MKRNLSQHKTVDDDPQGILVIETKYPSSTTRTYLDRHEINKLLDYLRERSPFTHAAPHLPMTTLKHVEKQVTAAIEARLAEGMKIDPSFVWHMSRCCILGAVINKKERIGGDYIRCAANLLKITYSEANSLENGFANWKDAKSSSPKFYSLGQKLRAKYYKP